MTPAQAISSWTEKEPLIRNAALIIIGSLVLAGSSQIAVPLIPVPMTMQTLAVLLIGAFYNPRLAFMTCCTYLFEGALGLNVFAGGVGGPQHLIGPTAGYLITFPFAAAFIAYAFERGWATNVYAIFGAMIVSHLIVFAGGVTWLSKFIGLGAAIAGGFTPFILGTLVKSALATAVVQLSRRKK